MNWFERITGFSETTYAEAKARLRISEGRLVSDASFRTWGIGNLETPTLAQLRARTPAPSGTGSLTCQPAKRDVREIHSAPTLAGATFQVASQFNLLEMIGPGATPEDGVSWYDLDKTQGPACAIAAGAGTIYRNYFAPVDGQEGQTADRQLDMLADLGDELAARLGVRRQDLWDMRNGYAFPDLGHAYRAEEYLLGAPAAARDSLRGLLRVGTHWDVEVTDSAAPEGQTVSQIYCAALPISYSAVNADNGAELGILILEAAYEATLRAAAINAAAGGSNRVILTRVGGGAFGNPDHWIDYAILRATTIMGEHDLEIFTVDI